jgi:transglutaminase-like putative cysteine protease
MRGRHDRELLDSLRRLDGWFTLGLVALICATLAWSLDDAMLVLGRDELTDFLVWTALAGAALGVVGPLVGWGRWTTHLIGAALAALVVPLLVGSVVLHGGGSLGQQFQATTDEVVTAWSDLVLGGRFSTAAYGHHLLVLGLITWATSQFASYATFGHRRPINAVVVIGLLLLANMSLTLREQLIFMVIFSVASLFLLVRFHTLDEQGDWLRRRIGDPSAISALYLRGGTIFIIGAITGSLVLTNAASSAPLSGAWTDVGARLVEWGQWLQPFLPDSGSGRSLGPTFGDSARIGRTWHTSDELQLQVDLSAPESAPPFLATVFYDQFELQGWAVSHAVASTNEPAGADLLAGTGDQIVTDVRRPLTATITPAYTRRDVFLPGQPASVSQDVTVRTIGTDGYLASVVREPSNAPYTISTYVQADEASGGWTQAKLRAAGTDYPPDVVALYGRNTLPADSLGPDARAFLQEIVATSKSKTPYDLADRINTVLRDPNQFTYSPDLSDMRCDAPSMVECFVQYRHGFCQWYATAMTVFLRELGIPARFVQGFLPGEQDAAGTHLTIRVHDAHAWVQAYFPGYGWVDFDPTGNPNAPQLAPIPSGRPVASASAKPSGALGSGVIRPSFQRPEPDEPGGSVAGRRSVGSAGLLIAVALLLAIVVGAIATLAWRRGPRGPVSPEEAYRSVSRIASRLGFAPRPTQTVYEYAGALADELPAVRPELETVARAKVEVAYGGRTLGDDRLTGLLDAYRRLRVQLLRLVLRRRRRRGRTPRPRLLSRRR